MGAFRQFLQRPRQSGLRKLLFQVHLWVGLGLGLYVLVMGVTGSALVFADELEGLLHPEIEAADQKAGAPAPASALLAAARRAFPERQATALYGPTSHRPTAVVYMKRGDDVLHAYLHPVSATLAASTTSSTSAVRWLQDLHFNLFSGRTGRTVNGVGAVMLFLLCVTGIVLWWPGAVRWTRSLMVDFGRNWRRINWEIHSAAGFWTAGLLAMWALTGFYFGFSQQVNGWIHRLSPVSSLMVPESRPGVASTKPEVEKMIADAAERVPNGRFFGLQLPAGKRSTYIVFMARDTPGTKQNCDYLYFDRTSGAYLGTWHRGLSASAGDEVIRWIVPLHFGLFGGLPIRILWSVLGLTPALLFVTATMMWWNRVLRHKVVDQRAAVPGAAKPLEASSSTSTQSLLKPSEGGVNS
ncbi:PepSY-associated TM helix domain-containing protein [uncultured Paludibaculum sp.]|uniref:PepSY-associated TM helix domain-containing protein n=1 Tax=uncultured Paludibaculum sp. TaxID=1765020 RepID=UPI002AABE148|nr:PepSY-associated TM helix domain-containing protein [uncultured Paludibaculum sp.]